MEQITIIYPAATLAVFTMGISFVLVGMRFYLVWAKKTNPGYFKLNRGQKMPDYHTRLEQHYSNLFEFPVLFYSLVAVLLASGKVDDTYIWLAWGYVGLRFVHSIIHTTYNHILHRLFIFGMSCLLVTGMWIKLALSI